MSDGVDSSSMGAASSNAARTPGTRRAPDARRTPALPLSAFDVLAVLGFACLLTALLIYSASAMPFQRFATLPGFISVMGPALRVCAGASLLVALAVAFGAGRFVRSLPARAVFSVALVAGNVMFCAMALAGAWDARTFWYVGGCMGVGCIGALLSWGRVLSRYNLRQATGFVAASSVLAVLFGCVQLSLPEPGAVAFFLACTVAAAALPFVLGDCRGDCRDGRQGGVKADVGKGGAFPGASPAAQTSADGASPAASPDASPVARVRAFLEVALVPGIGLALFAMLMAMRGQYFFETYSQYVIIQIAVAALLLACMLLPASVPLLRTVYRGLIPLLSVAVLAFNYMSEALFGGSEYEMLLVIVLYTAAALLTITTLVGMAHAAEFSSDLVVAIACMLFCAVSVVTMAAAPRSGLSDSDTRAVIVISSGLYAAGMVVLALWRGLRADRDALLGLGLDRPRPKGRSAGAAGTATSPTAQPALAATSDADGLITEAGIEARCDSLAREYALTAREREVLGYLARGHSGVYISDELLISPNTVRTHIHNIYRKLGVTSREDVLRVARK